MNFRSGTPERTWATTMDMITDFYNEIEPVRNDIGFKFKTSRVRSKLGSYNNAITIDYQNMSNTMRDKLQIDEEMADWAGFGSWISFSVGAYLHPSKKNPAYQGCPIHMKALIQVILPRLINPKDWTILAEANVQIHTEMRAVYDTVISLIEAGNHPGDPEVKAATDALLKAPEFARHEPLRPNDQEWLEFAVDTLLEAYHTEDVDTTSQLVYAASIALSAVEQWRADRHIQAFLDSTAASTRIMRFVPKRYRKSAQDRLEELGTEIFTVFLTPRGVVYVGRPLRPPRSKKNYTNKTNSLDNITHPKACVARDAFYRENHNTDDWTQYLQRMAYIVDYFMYYQEDITTLDFTKLPKAQRLPSPIRSSMAGPIPASATDGQPDH